MASGRLAGVVVVPARAPFGFLLRRYAPTLALVAAGALASGALIAAVAIFGPARRRLQGLEDAARRLGAGDLTARAPSRGGDEVAAVATAFNTMADDLAARAEALAAADRARRQLLADVSHELTTPVTAMRGYLETLTMPEFQLDEATRARYLEIIGDETGRLERIIGDLLDLARLEGGGGALVVGAVPVAQLFARAAARHEHACREAGVTMTQVIEPGVDAVSGDRGRLEQALQNLVANAIRYAPRGTAVELRARRAPDGTVAISVADQGRGIAPEHLPHVFDRFYKAEGARAAGQTAAGQAPSGSGLGLSIVKAIVERHGGRVSVASQPGRTVFEIAGLPNCRKEGGG
jgi:signal transduction histidine kinase